jgi:hypothetical protein
LTPISGEDTQASAFGTNRGNAAARYDEEEKEMREELTNFEAKVD